MPSKVDTDKLILTESQDRRRKLSDADKAAIMELKDKMSIRKIALMYGVDRRLIQFLHFPERLEANKQRRAERGGSKIYYDKARNTDAVRSNRHYKQSLKEQGKL